MMAVLLQITMVQPKALRKFPVNFVYSGYYNNNGAVNRGSYGGYTSSVATDTTGNYGLDLGADYVNPGDHRIGYKYNGFPVRCISNN